MSCREIRAQLPESIREQLPSAEQAAVRAHLEQCGACRDHAAFEAALQEEMAARYSVPVPSADFERRVLAAASASSSGRKHHFAWGGAVAAALIVGLLLGQGIREPESVPVLADSSVPAELGAGPVISPVDRTVRLAFTAGEPLDNVTLTLELPPHVELSGLPGQHRVSWQVSLEQGDNVLALPLRILFPGVGELIAELDAGGRQKVFRTVVPEHPGIGEPAASSGAGQREEPAT